MWIKGVARRLVKFFEVCINRVPPRSHCYNDIIEEMILPLIWIYVVHLASPEVVR